MSRAERARLSRLLDRQATAFGFTRTLVLEARLRRRLSRRGLRLGTARWRGTAERRFYVEGPAPDRDLEAVGLRDLREVERWIDEQPPPTKPAA